MIGAKIPAVACAPIVAVFVALLSAELSAQPTTQGNLTIQVTDITGAVIPGARIEIDPSASKPGPVLKTDSQGQAVLGLPVGAHTLSITAPGFEKWLRKIEVQSGSRQMLTAKLNIGMVVSGPPIVELLPDLPLAFPEPIFLPLQPLLNLEPLPSRHARKRW
jgi:hypothetical protein